MKLRLAANETDVVQMIDVMGAVPRTGWTGLRKRAVQLIDVMGAVPRTGWTGCGNARSWPEHLSRRKPLARASVDSTERKRAWGNDHTATYGVRTIGPVRKPNGTERGRTVLY